MQQKANRKMHDFIVGPPLKQILLFALPLLLGNVFQQFYNMADTFIVGRTIGVQALAAVGCTGSLSWLIVGFAQGVTSGFSLKTAQHFGAGDGDGVRKSFINGLFLSGIITVVLTAISVPLTRPMLGWLNTPPELMEDATMYLVIIFWGIGAALLYNHLANSIRALGNGTMPLVFLVVACVANIVLDYIFILYAGMGVAGAAVATVVAQLLASALCFVYIVRRMPVLVRYAHINQINWQGCRQQLAAGLPMGFQNSIIAIGAVVLQVVLNGLGSAAVGAYTAASKVDQFATQPLNSVGVSVGTFAAQNYGAGKMQRIKKGALQSTAVNVAYGVVMGVLLIAFGGQIVTLFVGPGQQEVVALAQTYMGITASCYFILGILFTMRYTLQGIGLSFVPTLAGVIELVMRSAAALVLVRFLGFAGACFANPLAWIGSAIPLSITFFITMKKLGVLPTKAPSQKET
ncbi:MATE family efflux transporter [Ruminococcaceae bacterium OttesenSCG-928-A16]|nr:MATE family efflux transporter [Ruminococcaceae bacterium OttesenSCG-928-A16]